MAKKSPPRLPRRRSAILSDDERQRLRSEIVDIGEILTGARQLFDPVNPAAPGTVAEVALTFGVSRSVAAEALMAFTRTLMLGKSMPSMDILDADARAQLAEINSAPR
jgi:hypothetical protein